MATLEDEVKDLKRQNNELVQRVQYWKMTAAARENEKLNLMKDLNELRLKLSRLRNNGSVQASNLDAALQSASEKALAHLVRASGEIARSMDLAKAYMRDRQELDAASPRWSSIGSTPTSVKKDKVHRVPPLMMGGQSIQPVVALTMLNTSNPRSAIRSPNPNRNVTERAVPMHMLQDVYIPLTRIDAGEVQAQNMETEDNNANNSTEDLGLNDGEEREMDESQQMLDDEDFDTTQRLDAVAEDSEPENEEVTTPPRSRLDNPLEGPSWMLDTSSDNQTNTSTSRTNLEPDSTTELEERSHNAPSITVDKRNNNAVTVGPQLGPLSVRVSCEFSPTVRRRKRTSSPPPAATPRRLSHFSPRPVASRRISNSGRVLKVLVAKMRLEGEPERAAGGGGRGGGRGEAGDGDASPPKRAAPAPATFDAPSPNGATVAGVIVSESHTDSDCPEAEPGRRRRAVSRAGPDRDRSVDRRRASSARPHTPNTNDGSISGQEDISNDDVRPASFADRDSRPNSRCKSRATNRCDSRNNSRAISRRDSRDSDSGSGGDTSETGRTRRTRKVVTYKEKPLNVKLRR